MRHRPLRVLFVSAPSALLSLLVLVFGPASPALAVPPPRASAARATVASSPPAAPRGLALGNTRSALGLPPQAQAASAAHANAAPQANPVAQANAAPQSAVAQANTAPQANSVAQANTAPQANPVAQAHAAPQSAVAQAAAGAPAQAQTNAVPHANPVAQANAAPQSAVAQAAAASPPPAAPPQTSTTTTTPPVQAATNNPVVTDPVTTPPTTTVAQAATNNPVVIDPVTVPPANAVAQANAAPQSAVAQGAAPPPAPPTTIAEAATNNAVVTDPGTAPPTTVAVDPVTGPTSVPNPTHTNPRKSITTSVVTSTTDSPTTLTTAPTTALDGAAITQTAPPPATQVQIDPATATQVQIDPATATQVQIDPATPALVAPAPVQSDPVAPSVHAPAPVQVTPLDEPIGPVTLKQPFVPPVLRADLRPDLNTDAPPPLTSPPAPAGSPASTIQLPTLDPAQMALPNTDLSIAAPLLGAEFGALADELADLIGAPIQAPQSASDTCDLAQLTTTGVVYLLCSTGELGFAALPDGMHHWALSNGELLEWIGPEMEPPFTAAPADLSVCTDPLSTYCRIAPNLPVAGYLQAANATNGYNFMLADTTTHLVATLSNLPADYDLYVVDGSGSIVADSVHEGITPEVIDTVLPAGTYTLYVHVDPARAFDPDNPYQLTLSLGQPDTVEAPPTDEAPAVGNNAAAD